MLGERIARLRAKRSLSQLQLLKIMGKLNSRRGGTIVSDWECGRSEPRAQDYPALARALRCSIDYLVTGREAPKLAALQRAILSSSSVDPRLVAMVTHWAPANE